MAENPNDVAERWAKGMVSAVPKMKEKIMALSINPMQEAAKQQDAYVAGVMAAAESGKWKAGLMSVSLDDWKRKTAEIGTQRVSAGVQQAKPKMVNFLAQLLPYTENVSKQIAAMPNNNLEDKIARMVANTRAMAAFKPRKG